MNTAQGPLLTPNGQGASTSAPPMSDDSNGDGGLMSIAVISCPRKRAALACGAMLGAIAICLLFDLTVQGAAFTVVLPAIAVASWFGGWRVGVVTTCAVALLVVVPWHSGWTWRWTPLSCVRLWAFAATSLSFCGFAELNRRHESRLDRAVRDREDLVQRLTASNRAKDEFLSLVSHELRTPLTTIGGNADVLRRHGAKLDEESQVRALDDIISSSQRLNCAIDDMLLLATADRGKALEVEPVMPHRIAGKAASECSRVWGRDIEVSTQQDYGYALAHERGLHQVLDNLLNNAAKYSPTGTAIEVTTRRANDEVLISVLDRGIGVADDETEVMFKPFYRSPIAAYRAGGMGLGLAVCQRLVAAMNGRIWAEPRDGGGTAFTIALPRAAEDEESVTSTPPALSVAGR